MKRAIRIALATSALVLALAGPATAHEVHVGPNDTSHWVGGFTLPEPAWSAPPVFGPFHLPPSHATGLPHACEATRQNPSAVTFVAPPYGSCHHGQP